MLLLMETPKIMLQFELLCQCTKPWPRIVLENALSLDLTKIITPRHKNTRDIYSPSHLHFLLHFTDIKCY